MPISIYQDMERLYFADRAAGGGYRIFGQRWGASKPRALSGSGVFDRFGEAQVTLDRLAAKRGLNLCCRCRCSTGVVANPDAKSCYRFSVGCTRAEEGALLAFARAEQAWDYIEQNCTGDGRFGCRVFLIGDLALAGVGWSHEEGSKELLTQWERIEGAMPKQTFYCPCGKTFVKGSPAEVTGLRLEGYADGHECRGCPFVYRLTEWSRKGETTIGYECRASRSRIDYVTRAKWRREDTSNAYVYTLDRDWLGDFIADYLDGEMLAFDVDRDDPDALERCFRGTERVGGKRVYSFSFRPNREGLTFKTELLDRFFGLDNVALAS